MRNDFRIGEVAERSGVSIDTVRYYERRRLLPVAPRTENGYRVFPSGAIDRILFIKQAQEMGFTLDEIGSLLTTRTGVDECHKVSELLQVKLADLDDHFKKIQDFRRTLKIKLAECEHERKIHGEAAVCPVLITIEENK